MILVRRLIAVIDLFASTESVTQRAMIIAKQTGAILHFVTLFDHMNGCEWEATGSSQEQFERIERELMLRLQHHVAQTGRTDIPCKVLTGHPGEAMAVLAKEWQADLILADLDTARVIQNGWIPCFHPVTQLPCRLQVVSVEEDPLLSYLTRWLSFFGMFRKNSKVSKNVLAHKN